MFTDQKTSHVEGLLDHLNVQHNLFNSQPTFEG